MGTFVFSSDVFRHARLATAWMQEVEQRMEQLPNRASMLMVNRVDSRFRENDTSLFRELLG
ncbi:MAG: hypothetical protein KAJ73_06200 [Zetaproteobacteria bacterium]|nr:hypothetical protein [Zetaproteobacteria bacterium]